MSHEEVHSYLMQLSGTQLYELLTEESQRKAVFTARAVLADDYPEKHLDARAVSLQTLFMLEGEEETMAMLRRQGATQYATKGVSVTLTGTDIAPAVKKMLDKRKGRKSFGWIV